MRSLFLRMARDDALIERTSEPISRGLFAMHPAPSHAVTVSSDVLIYIYIEKTVQCETAETAL